MARRFAAAVVTITALVFAIASFASAQATAPEPAVVSQAAAPAPRGVGTPPEDPGRGLVWAGLRAASNSSQCRGGYEARAGDTTVCTHGPDASPTGVDVRKGKSNVDLLVAEASTGTAAAGSGVPCYGDGASGKRVQALYVVAADRPDRYATVAPLIPAWAANVDRAYSDSAAETGGVRHVRFVTDAGCNLVVGRVQLSATGDDSFANTINELKTLGFNRTDRKYLIWADASVYCGIGGIMRDDRSISTNANNIGPSYGRVDSGCWGLASSVEAHELMHNLGGVQVTAPHTSGGWHCTDESDRMCYRDAVGVAMTAVCASTHERLFDCGHDDYYSTAPPANSYLATHWNAADSAFLEQVDPPAWGAGAATTSTTSTSTTSTTVAPTTTSTTISPTTVPPGSPVSVTFKGSLSRKNASRTHSVNAGAGSVNATLSFSKAPSMELSVTANGTTVVAANGGPPIKVSATVTGGTVNFVVRAPSGSYTLNVTYPSQEKAARRGS